MNITPRARPSLRGITGWVLIVLGTTVGISGRLSGATLAGGMLIVAGALLVAGVLVRRGA